MALLWAGGIIWTAVEFASDAPSGPRSGTAATTHDATGRADAAADAEQMKQTQKLLEQLPR